MHADNINLSLAAMELLRKQGWKNGVFWASPKNPNLRSI